MGQLQQFLSQMFAAGDVVNAITLFTNANGTRPAVVNRAQLWFGAVAFALRSHLAHELVHYVRSRFDAQPVDFLLRDFLDSKEVKLWSFYPNLVQHIGWNSSLKGKVQPMQSPSFSDSQCTGAPMDLKA